MSLQPLLEAPWVIQAHAFSAIAAFFLGVIQFAAPKGTLPHKTIGAVWIFLMAVIAGTSIFVRPSLHPGLPIWKWFSPIHLLTLLTIYALVQGVYLLMRGGPRLKRHAGPFIGLFIGGLIVAGVLAVALPGRIMNQIVFGS